MKQNRSFLHPFAIFLGVALIGGCLLIGFALATGGLIAWRFYPLGAESGIPPATQILATPIQPAPATATPRIELAPTPAITVTQPITPGMALTVTAPADLDLLTPTLPDAVPDTTEPAPPAAAGPALTPTTAATFPPVALDPSCIQFNRPSRRVRVVEAIDAITIEVDDAGDVYRVSYIGVALPPGSEDPAVWSAAQAYNQRLVEGQTVLLVQDRSDQDNVGYRPRYVLAGGVFVNMEMIASGYAVAAARPPDLSCQILFEEAQQRASASQVGLWAPVPTATRILLLPPTATVAVTGPMKITALAERGTLWQEPEEWVEIRNESEDPIQLEGWSIQDNERHIFTFPAFTLGPGQYCRVYTNEYHPTSCGFLYGSQSPIWNNDTDCAYLKDPYGRLISTFCYGFQ